MLWNGCCSEALQGCSAVLTLHKLWSEVFAAMSVIAAVVL